MDSLTVVAVMMVTIVVVEDGGCNGCVDILATVR